MSGPLLLGIEIGGTKLQLGLGRADGRLLALDRRAVEPLHGAGAIREQIVAALPTLRDRLPTGNEPIDAIGIGFGGPVEPDRGLVTVSNQIDGWAGFPLVAWAKEALGVSCVVLQNDADTAALGEARFGAGIGVSPVVYVTIGSGIGGGLVVDGSIYRGAGRGSIEIGHLIIQDESDSPDPAQSAARETLESLASGWSIGREARRLTASLGREGASRSSLLRLAGGDPSRITAALVAEAAREGDPLAIQALRRATTALGRALAHAVTLLAPRRIILGGGVSLIGEADWFEPVRRETESRVFPPFRGSFDIVPAALGEEVVVHGALALALDASRVSSGAGRATA